MPTVPPSSQPTASTVTSIRVRTRRIGQPRPARPVISPSRGPEPSPAPMYSPVPTPLVRIPAARKTTRTTSARGWGSSGSTASATSPTTITLLTVPMPGRCRSGTQSSRTATLTAMSTDPMGSPARLASPWWNTSHGSSPSRAETSSGTLTPNRTSPTYNWASRRTAGRGTATRRATVGPGVSMCASTASDGCGCAHRPPWRWWGRPPWTPRRKPSRARCATAGWSCGPGVSMCASTASDGCGCAHRPPWRWWGRPLRTPRRKPSRARCATAGWSCGPGVWMCASTASDGCGCAHRPPWR